MEQGLVRLSAAAANLTHLAKAPGEGRTAGNSQVVEKGRRKARSATQGRPGRARLAPQATHKTTKSNKQEQKIGEVQRAGRAGACNLGGQADAEREASLTTLHSDVDTTPIPKEATGFTHSKF